VLPVQPFELIAWRHKLGFIHGRAVHLMFAGTEDRHGLSTSGELTVIIHRHRANDSSRFQQWFCRFASVILSLPLRKPILVASLARCDTVFLMPRLVHSYPVFNGEHQKNEDTSTMFTNIPATLQLSAAGPVLTELPWLLTRTDHFALYPLTHLSVPAI